MPKIVFNPAIKSLLDISGKKSILELKPVRVTRLSKLSLMRDLDGNVVTYSSLTDNINNPKVNNFPDSYDLLPYWERKSSQREYSPFRDEELYNPTLDNKEFIFHKYSTDDVPLSDNLVQRELGIGGRIPSVHYPSTDIHSDDLPVLKLIHFREEILPSCFGEEMKLEDSVINEYLDAALVAFKNGVGTNQIIKMVEKSVLNPLVRGLAKPDPKLFEVLTRNPNARNIYIVKDNMGVEFYDEVAALYANRFKDRYFASEEVAYQVLNECKNKNLFPVPSVNKDLCSVVCAIRSENNKILYKDYWHNIDRKAPWDEKCSQLLEELKKFPSADIGTACNGVNFLLKDCGCSIDFVLNNLSAVASRFSRINKVDSLTDPRITSPVDKVSYYLKGNLSDEVIRAKETSGVISSESPVEECALHMLTEKFHNWDCLYAVKNLIDIQKYAGEDVQNYLKIIDMAFFKGGTVEYHRNENMMKLIVDSAKKFGNFSQIEKLYDKYCTGIPKADIKTVYSSLDTIIKVNWGIETDALLAKIELQLPKVIQYNQKYRELAQGLTSTSITNSIKYYELKKMCAKDDFELKDCVGLDAISDFYYRKLTVNELREVQNKLK